MSRLAFLLFDDWTTAYVDGHKVCGNHSLGRSEWLDIVEALGVDASYRLVEVDGDGDDWNWESPEAWSTVEENVAKGLGVAYDNDR